MQKLWEEMEADGPDVIEILSVFKMMANSNVAKERMDTSIGLYKKLRNRNVKNLINVYVCLSDNRQRDLKFKKWITELERKVLMDLFLQFVRDKKSEMLTQPAAI